MAGLYLCSMMHEAPTIGRCAVDRTQQRTYVQARQQRLGWLLQSGWVRSLRPFQPQTRRFL